MGEESLNTAKGLLLIVGKSEKKRHEFVKGLIEKASKQVFIFPSNLEYFDQYIDQVRKLFPFVPVGWPEQNPNKWTLNQVWDFHLDWTNDTYSILIVIEEFGKMEENWKIQILRDYLTTSYYQEKPDKSIPNFQLIVTLEEEGDSIEKLSAVFGLKENDKRTERQVIEGKLRVVNLEWI